MAAIWSLSGLQKNPYDLFLSADYTNPLVREAVQRAHAGGEKVMFNVIENRIQGRAGGWIPMWPDSDNEDFHWDKIDYRLTQHLPATPPQPWSLGRTVNGHTLPSGAEWHCAKDWKPEMLDGGWRPCIVGETLDAETEWLSPVAGNWIPRMTSIALVGPRLALHRTKKPIPTAPALVPWSFEDAPEGPLKVKFKHDGLPGIARLFPDGYNVAWSMASSDYEQHTFASLLANFTTLDGEPCGKEGK